MAGTFLKLLDGRVVALAVNGARKFKASKGLGLGLYEGCSCLIMRRDLGDRAAILEQALRKFAKGQEKILGTDVYVSEHQHEQDLWTVYVAIPRPNVLLCATDRGFLTEVLKRMDSPKPLRPRAFPEELPEWKHVDRKARYWGMHHYSKKARVLFKSFQTLDPDAVGLAYVYQPRKDDKKATVKTIYVTNSRDDRTDMVKQQWSLVGNQAPMTVKKLAPGAFQMTTELSQEQTNLFLFLLLAHLGFVIAT